MRFILKTKNNFAKKRSAYDKSVPSYEEVLLEVERRQALKLKEKTQKDQKGNS